MHFRLWQSQNIMQRYSDWSFVNEPSKKKVTDMPPMDQPVPNLPRAVYSNLKEGQQKTQVTVLSNGLTVASESRFGEFSTVGGKWV